MNVNITLSQCNQRRLIAEVCKAFAVLALLTACTTVPTEVSLKKLREKERVYVGRFKVRLNGKSQPRCEVYVNYDLGPVVRLAENSSGFVIYRTDRDRPRFTRITCLHDKSRLYSAWHQQNLELEKLARTDSSSKAVYFGDVLIDWTIDEADSEHSAQSETPEPDGHRVGHVKDSGSIKVSVASDLPAAQAEWSALFSSDASTNGVSLAEDLVKKEN